jgi:spoIIIJ-associated protein
LNLNRDEIDVEIIDSNKKGIFRKGTVKIRVLVKEEQNASVSEGPESDFEETILDFATGLLEKMGFPGEVAISDRQEGKLHLAITSPHSRIIIGKKGKNLDAIQLLVNVIAGKMQQDVRIIIDTENYRLRREETIIRMARKIAQQVRKTKGSKLLEPMNPFERRLIHTTLNEYDDIHTISEGDGVFKQVRIFFKYSDK